MTQLTMNVQQAIDAGYTEFCDAAGEQRFKLENFLPGATTRAEELPFLDLVSTWYLIDKSPKYILVADAEIYDAVRNMAVTQDGIGDLDGRVDEAMVRVYETHRDLFEELAKAMNKKLSAVPFHLPTDIIFDFTVTEEEYDNIRIKKQKTVPSVVSVEEALSSGYTRFCDKDCEVQHALIDFLPGSHRRAIEIPALDYTETWYLIDKNEKCFILNGEGLRDRLVDDMTNQYELPDDDCALATDVEVLYKEQPVLFDKLADALTDKFSATKFFERTEILLDLRITATEKANHVI